MTVKVKQVDWLSMHLEVSFHLLFTLSNPRKQREDHRSCSRRSGHAIRHDFSFFLKKKKTPWPSTNLILFCMVENRGLAVPSGQEAKMIVAYCDQFLS